MGTVEDDASVGRGGRGHGDDRSPPTRVIWRWTVAAIRALYRLGYRSARLVGPYPVLVISLAVGTLGAVGLTAVAAETYEAVAENDGIASLDRPVLNAAVAVRSPRLNALVTGLTDLGGPVGMPMLATTLAVVLALLQRRWTPVVLVAVTGAGSLVMTVVGKLLVDRIRPPLAAAVAPYESSASFPSGHALNAAAIAGILAYLLMAYQRRWLARAVTFSVAGAFAVGIGLSRIYLGHHWLTDVIVAWSLGLAWLSIVIMLHRLHLTIGLDRRRHRGPNTD